MLANSFPRRWIPSVLFKGLAEFRTLLLTMLATPLKTSKIYLFFSAFKCALLEEIIHGRRKRVAWPGQSLPGFLEVLL